MKKRWNLPLILLVVCFLVMPAAAEGEAPPVYGSGDYEYTLAADGTAEITAWHAPNEIASLVIPAALDGYPIARTGDWVFHSYDLTSVTLPDTLVEIGEGAFAFCDWLQAVHVSADHPLFLSADGILFNKDGSALLIYPAGKPEAAYAIPEGTLSVGPCAFAGSYTLTAITLPDSLTEIGDGAFCAFALTSFSLSPEHPAFAVRDDALLRTADGALLAYPAGLDAADYAVPPGVSAIAERAFAFCRALTEVTLPEGLTVIGDKAFFECFSLESAALPDGLLSIGDGAFDSCFSLTNLTLPESLKSIGSGAFFWCSSLASVTVPAGVWFIGDGAFSGCDSLTLTVARDSYAQEYAVKNGIPYQYTDTVKP